MTPEAFIAKWRASTLSERAGAQPHFHDLCALLGEKTPSEADPAGESYSFERGATKTTGAAGWADVWKRGHFGWEYKSKGGDLQQAYAQLQQYAIALDNPPLLIVSDMETIIVHTNWTNTVHETHTIGLDDLRSLEKREILRAAFADPERLKPGRTRQKLTEDAAKEFAIIAQRLRDAGHDPQRVAHFVNRLVFCMFAEDVGLLPSQMFTRMLEEAVEEPAALKKMAADLFRAMQTGGRVGFQRVSWFNGGLFDDDDALPLDKPAIEQTLRAARLDWSEIDPSIFGTLFERGLDPDKRSQLGAHYTDRDKIMMIVEPVIIRPLTREWEATKAAMLEALGRIGRAKSPAAARKTRKEARALSLAFLERLRGFRVLDPACGSGNFLYLALLALKDLEHRVNLECEAMGFDRPFPAVGPEAVHGIEINRYAAELARATVWIGEIQWMRRNGFNVTGTPILRPLDTIECRDAVLNPDGTEAAWPAAVAIIGNPPFLGDKVMIGTLGEEYTNALRRTYAGRVPGGADLVCYWFEKARGMIDAGTMRVGLVATQSIRRRVNRKVLDRLLEKAIIYEAWSDEPWVVEGASVRVSILCLIRSDIAEQGSINLNGNAVQVIFSDLAAGGVDLTKAAPLSSNAGVAFIGTQKNGPFEIPGSKAREWLSLPLNPNGRPNADVVRPWVNGMDLTRRPSDTWIIDFGCYMDESDAAFFQAPFQHVVSKVKPTRVALRREGHRKYWWRHGEARPGMRDALAKLERFIVTPRVAKHRLFVWMPTVVLPDSRVTAIACDDDASFGILHSRIHEVWSLALGGWHGVGNDPQYTPSAVFETFPFPEGLTPNNPAADYASDPRAFRIAESARTLNELRESWLNPPDLVQREPEVVPGLPRSHPARR